MKFALFTYRFYLVALLIWLFPSLGPIFEENILTILILLGLLSIVGGWLYRKLKIQSDTHPSALGH